MTETMHLNDRSQPDIFKNSEQLSHGFIGDCFTLITRPVEFFTRLGERRASPHTRLIAVLILIILAIVALQMPMTDSTQVIEIPFEPIPTDGMPFDPGFPPPAGGIVDGGGTQGGDPTTRWITVLTTISRQVLIWGALMILLSIVTLMDGYMPPFGKNLEIAIWASIPLALMAGLQLAFISGGGTISANGFSGFLNDWEMFTQYDMGIQSVIHAFAQQFTLFWLWGLWLLYVGMRFTLRGKRVVVLFTMVMWVVLSTLVYSFHSYEILSNTIPFVEELMPMDEFPQDMPIDSEMLPDGEFPQEIPTDDMMQESELAMNAISTSMAEITVDIQYGE